MNVVMVKRSVVGPDMKYSVEQQAPAGNWVKTLGTNDLQMAKGMAAYAAKRGDATRVVLEAE